MANLQSLGPTKPYRSRKSPWQPMWPDCVQIIIALVVTPEGLPLGYEVLPGNTADKTTLRGFLERIERQYGKARRIWQMDRGVPTEEVLAEMRAADPPVHYLVGTPK